MGAYTIVQTKDQLSKLIDKAADGETVKITRHGKEVASIVPAQAPPRRMTAEDLEAMRRRRESRPMAEVDAVTAVREMRDEDP
jgi:prevent-host-death family protein